jgi:LSD1 subclass zinc finger protein
VSLSDLTTSQRRDALLLLLALARSDGKVSPGERDALAGATRDLDLFLLEDELQGSGAEALNHVTDEGLRRWVVARWQELAQADHRLAGDELAALKALHERWDLPLPVLDWVDWTRVEAAPQLERRLEELLDRNRELTRAVAVPRQDQLHAGTLDRLKAEKITRALIRIQPPPAPRRVRLSLLLQLVGPASLPSAAIATLCLAVGIGLILIAGLLGVVDRWTDIHTTLASLGAFALGLYFVARLLVWRAVRTWPASLAVVAGSRSRLVYPNNRDPYRLSEVDVEYRDGKRWRFGTLKFGLDVAPPPPGSRIWLLVGRHSLLRYEQVRRFVQAPRTPPGELRAREAELFERLFQSAPLRSVAERDEGPEAEALRLERRLTDPGPWHQSAGRVQVTIGERQLCSFCRETLAGEAGAALMTCSACQAVYHRECLQEARSCLTLGCRNRRS